ncbi:MmpS family transport accessory protein [Nonomuraea fuscirosea]|uniref:MmpS family transport accessory protein n=1 Tax=Nonomuraea fuscirosea TaxID=1291556 RepID=UPI00343AD6E0
MTGAWHPPDQHPSDQHPSDQHPSDQFERDQRPSDQRQHHQPPPESGDERWRPGPSLPNTPPTPALGIISLLMGGIGAAAAAFFPLLRLPGVLLGLIGAGLGVVTVAVKPLGGKLLATGGFALGLASVPIAVLLFLQQFGEPAAIVAPPSVSSAEPSREATTLTGPAEVEFEVIGYGVDVASIAYRIDSRSRTAGTVDESFIQLPYRRTVELDEAPLSMWLIAGRSAEQGSLVCRIKANGLVLDEERVTVDNPASECKAEWWAP